MLEKKEKVLLRKAAAEIERAKEFTRAKNKRGVAGNIEILLLAMYVFFFFWKELYFCLAFS